MTLGAGIAIAAIWGAVAVTAVWQPPLMVIVAFMAMFATLIIASGP